MIIFQYNLYIFGIHLWTVLYPKPCYNDPCYKEVEVYLSLAYNNESCQVILTLLLLNTCPVLANSVDSNQLASEEAKWSGSALFVIKYVNFY